MALTVKHAFVSGKPAGPDPSKVQAPHWDADHVITGGPANGTLVPVGTVVDFCGISAPAGWLECAGQILEGALYPDLYAALVKGANVTITIASPAVITWAGHGLPVGAQVWFGTSGVLPTGIVSGARYYVLSTGYAAGSFRISSSIEGVAVNTSGSQSGVHYSIFAPFGAGGTTFTLPDFRDVVIAGMSIMNNLGPPTLKLEGKFHAMGEVIGVDAVPLTTSHMPSHAHGGLTGSQDANHTHGVSGSISGATDFRDVNHVHGVAHEYWNNAQGSGGHSALQPDFQTGADGTFTKETGGSTTPLNHQHTVSGSFSGGTGIESLIHRHGIGAQGGGLAHPNVQPTTFMRKIIFTGVGL